jgi:hypothetical protein
VRRIWLVLTLLLCLGMAAAQGEPADEGMAPGGSTTYGIRIDLDLPMDHRLLDFASNPFTYALNNFDVIDARAFVQFDRLGIEGRFKSATEVYAGIYYALTMAELFGQFAESTFGFYLGHDWDEGTTFSLKGSIRMYGSFP